MVSGLLREVEFMLYVILGIIVLLVIVFMVLANRVMDSTTNPRIQKNDKDPVKNADTSLSFFTSIFNWSGRK